MGTRHQPHSARSCVLAWRALGAARGCSGWAPLAWMWGVRGRALSHPRPLLLSNVRPGPTTHWLWVRGVRVWGPVFNSTARALASRLCALWRRHEGARGGAPLAWVWGVWCRALSHPRPLVLLCVRPGPTTHWLWVRGLRAWRPVPTPPRALLQPGFARCGGGMRVPGGGRLLPGRAGSGALPAPTARPLGRAAGAHYPLAVGAGGAGVGTCHQPHSAHSCELALRAVGAERRRPRGRRLLPGCGASGVKRSPTPDRPFFGVFGGDPLPTGCGCGGRGRGDPSPTPQRALLRAGLARCGDSMRVPGGDASCLRVGRPGSGALPSPTTGPLGRAAGGH